MAVFECASVFVHSRCARIGEQFSSDQVFAAFMRLYCLLPG